jgi:hypothetical protein
MENILENSIWGVKFNRRPDYGERRSKFIPKGCPPWLRPVDVDIWCNKGIVIWKNASEKIIALNAADALNLLNEIKTTEDWKTNGVSVKKRFWRVKINAEVPKKAKNKGTGGQNIDPNYKSNFEPVEEELFKLLPEAGEELKSFLSGIEAALCEMNQEEEREISERLHKVYEMIFDFFHEDEGKKIDWKAREFLWMPSTDAKNRYKWFCEKEKQNRGVVYLQENKLFWSACVENKRKEQNWGGNFVNLMDAVQWVEQEIAKKCQEIDDGVPTEKDSNLER